MNILIIDDEINSRTLLATIAEQIPAIDHIETANSAIEAIAILNRYKPDIVLLDIEMPGGSGFHFLTAIPERSFKVIFVTAHSQYAIKAIKNRPYDYILKPVDPNAFKKLINQVVDETQLQDKKIFQDDRIVVNTLKETFFIEPRDVVQITSAGNYCIYQLKDGQGIVASYVLKKAAENLSESIFFRVNKSHIVNLNYVEKVVKEDGFTVVLKNGSEILLSRRRKEAFIEKMSNKL